MMIELTPDELNAVRTTINSTIYDMESYNENTTNFEWYDFLVKLSKKLSQ